MLRMLNQSRRKQNAPVRLTVDVAATEREIEETQRLRYQIFAEEMGAQLGTLTEGLDIDRFDAYCHHILVRDLDSGEVVASTRILTDTQARLAGSFYSQTEFELDAILALPGRMMEMGRTCVRRSHRQGAAIGMLWSGVAQFMVRNRCDYLIGCTSISMRDGGAQAHATLRQLQEGDKVPSHLRALPKDCLVPADYAVDPAIEMPGLLKAYLRWGAKVCGEPCVDRAFNVADLLMLLRLDQVEHRYLKRYLEPIGFRPTAAAPRRPSCPPMLNAPAAETEAAWSHP